MRLEVPIYIHDDEIIWDDEPTHLNYSILQNAYGLAGGAIC